MYVLSKYIREDDRYMEHITITNFEFCGATKKGKLYIEGDFYEKDNHVFFFHGNLIEREQEIDSYFTQFLNRKIDFVKQMDGDFCLFDYDCSSEILTISTDRFGKKTPYIFQKDQKIMFTTNFWKGISIIRPNEDEINWSGVPEFTFHNYILPRETIVKGYSLIPPASYAEWEIEKSSSIQFEQYWHFEFSEAYDISLDEAVEKLDEIYDNTFKKLKESYPNDTRFGIGLSGGWDSRLTAAYAQKNGFNLVPFCLGQKYSVFPFHTYGYSVVKRLAKAMGIKEPVAFISYNKSSAVEKIIDDVMNEPLSISEMPILGGRPYIPQYDVLLTGCHGGEFLGEVDYLELGKYTKETVSDYIIHKWSWVDGYDMLFDDKSKAEFNNKVNNLIQSYNAKNATEAAVRFLIEINYQRWKDDLFLHGEYSQKSYSPFYTKEFLDYYVKLNPVLQIDRTLQRELFIKKFENLSKIPDETCDAPLYWRTMGIKHLPKRFYYAGLNYVLKSSMQRKAWVKKDKDYRSLMFKVSKKNDKYIKKYFANMDINKFYQVNPRASQNFTKIMIEIEAALKCPENVADYIREQYENK